MELTVDTVKLHPDVVEAIKKHSRKERDKGSYEAVGFVAKRSGKSRGIATVPLHNHSPEPQHGFFVEPWEQYRAEKKLEQQGYEIMAIYHSHTNSEALPSHTDHQFCWPDGYVFIYSVVFDELRAYHERDSFLEPVKLEVGGRA